VALRESIEITTVFGNAVLHSDREIRMLRELRGVEQGSTVYSDVLRSYDRLEEEFIHNVINHSEEYVRGHVHTNGIENFWSLLKRSPGGTYIQCRTFSPISLP
jgi:transposase-like protein